MITCKKCNSLFKTKIVINGKKVNLNNRSYCLGCSPFKVKKDKINHEQQTKKCTLCEKEFSWTKNNVCSTCRSGIRRSRNRGKAIVLLGGKCPCGISDPDILTFHHTDPDKKDFNLCENWHLAWSKIEYELAKCKLLCYNCHMKLHVTERKKYTKFAECSSGEIGKHTGLLV